LDRFIIENITSSIGGYVGEKLLNGETSLTERVGQIASSMFEDEEFQALMYLSGLCFTLMGGTFAIFYTRYRVDCWFDQWAGKLVDGAMEELDNELGGAYRRYQNEKEFYTFVRFLDLVGVPNAMENMKKLKKAYESEIQNAALHSLFFAVQSRNNKLVPISEYSKQINALIDQLDLDEEFLISRVIQRILKSSIDKMLTSVKNFRKIAKIISSIKFGKERKNIPTGPSFIIASYLDGEITEAKENKQ